MNSKRWPTLFDCLTVIGVAIALAWIAAGPVQAGPAVPSKSSIAMDRTNAAVEWHTFAPPHAGFSVLMPGSATLTAATYFGITSHVFRCVTPVAVYGGQFFEVPAARLRAVGPQVVLNDAVASTVLAKNRRLLSLRPIRLNGHPGREFVLSLQDNIGEQRQAGRMFLVNNHCFMILAIRYPSGIDPYKHRADLFINSFRLVPPLH